MDRTGRANISRAGVLALAALCVVLVGCGRRGPLEPPPSVTAAQAEAPMATLAP